MEQIVRNVRDIATEDRRALEHVIGHRLRENQQLVIQVVSADAVADTPHGDGLPDWCDVYEGLSDKEIDEIEKSIIRTRTSWPCRAGSATDRPHWMSPDFDEPLDDFREHIE